MTIALQRVLMYKRRTWILLFKCRQTLRECLTFVRLTQKKFSLLTFFKFLCLFFWKWFSMILWSIMVDMMWWCMRYYDFLFELIWWCIHGCMDAWIKFAFFFIVQFSFILIDSKEIILFTNMNDSCMHDLVWCIKYLMYEFFFLHFFETNSNWSPFHCYFEFIKSFYFEIFFTFLNHLFGLSNLLTNPSFNHSFETLFEWHAKIAKGLKRLGWGDDY